MDGVLADMESELVRQAEAGFGEAMTAKVTESPSSDPPLAPPEDAPAGAPEEPAAEATPPLKRLHLTSRQQRRLWGHVESIENFWETLEEIEPGAVSKLATMAADRRWEIIFLTKRPRTVGSTSQVQSQRWLESKGFALPSVFVVQGSRGRIAASLDLDFVIDDRPENCLDVVVDSKARAILVWREDEKLLPGAARRLGIGVVKSVSECLDILHEIDGSTKQTGVVQRVMRLLGLKEPASV